MIKISFLCDNRCDCGKFEAEWGFSCLLTVDNYQLLIDTGETDLFLRNAKKMRIDIDAINNALITHGHFDHGGGASHLRGKDIFVHNRTFQKRFRPPTKEFARDENTLRIENKDKNNFIAISDNIVINDKIWLLANIPMKHDFEKGHSYVLENGELDMIDDEIAVAIKTDKGLAVISGCAHRGICNTIDYAKAVTGEQKVHCVIGGFHLMQWDEAAEKTLAWFKANKVGTLYMAHCNGDDVIAKFKQEMPNMVKGTTAGMELSIP